METIQYEYSLSDERLRRRRLRQAVLAFVSSAKESAASVHAIGLVVPIPSLSTTPFTTPLTSSSPPPASSGASAPHATAKAGEKATKDTASRTLGAVAPVKTAPATTTVKKKLSHKTRLMRLRHWQREAAQRACYATTEARLTQARADVKDLQQWLALTTHTLGVRDVSLLVIAALQPRTKKDVAFVRLWQYGSEAARASPLRLADLVSVSFASEKLLVSWSALYFKDEEMGGGQRRKIPPPFELESLLLPHQSLLLDLTWCVEAGFRDVAPRVVVAPPSVARGGKPPPPRPLTALNLAELFINDVLPTLAFPKSSSRSVGWLAYHSWLPLYSAALAQSAQRSRSSDEDAPPALAVAVHSVSACCAHMRWLFHALYGHPKAVGHRLAWRLAVGYGGNVDSLVKTSEQVLVDQPALRRRSGHRAGKGGKGQRAPPSRAQSRSRLTQTTGSPSQQRWWCAGLLPVRDLRDVYATLAVLVGQDQADLYSDALPVLRGMCRRVCQAQCLLATLPAEEMVLRALPERPIITARRKKGTTLALARAIAAKKGTSLTRAEERKTRKRAQRKKQKPGAASDPAHSRTATGADTPAPAKASAPSATPAPRAVKTTLSALLRRGRRIVLRRRRALRADAPSCSACRDAGASSSLSSLSPRPSTAKKGVKRGTAASDEGSPTNKVRRVEQTAERVVATAFDDVDLGWVEDV